MALGRLRNKMMAFRTALAVLGSAVLAVNSSAMVHIIIDGQHVGECWFHADYSTCQLVRLSASFTVFSCGSWVVFELLVTAEKHPKARRGFLWIEAFLAGQLTVLYIGMVILATVQWIRTAADWPNIALTVKRSLCPSSVGDDCLIPTHVHASAIAIILLSAGTTATWGWYFYWMKGILNHNAMLPARPDETSVAVTLPVEPVCSQTPSPIVTPPLVIPPPSTIGLGGHLAHVHLFLDQLTLPPTHLQPPHNLIPSCRNVPAESGHTNHRVDHVSPTQTLRRLAYEHAV